MNDWKEEDPSTRRNKKEDQWKSKEDKKIRSEKIDQWKDHEAAHISFDKLENKKNESKYQHIISHEALFELSLASSPASPDMEPSLFITTLIAMATIKRSLVIIIETFRDGTIGIIMGIVTTFIVNINITIE